MKRPVNIDNFYKPYSLGTKLLETVIANTEKRPDTRKLLEPNKNSWALKFPNLTSLKINKSGDNSAKICIATEDIVGPVRNGGIGTTYSYLAKILAADKFDVTILYLRKDYVEIETLEHWIEYYAGYGVKLVGVEDYYSDEKGAGNNDRWTAPMYNMLRHLQDFHYDVVHVSEWRGSGYLSLLAKRQGWAFENTHFTIKCSSPWLWNRSYGSQPINTIDDIDKIFTEQKSVELGDHIIGGSAHLLRWMASQGYDLKLDRTFVQPNILSTDLLDTLIKDRHLKAGQRIDTKEIVFFGRLEARKGIDIFIDAINILIRDGISLPTKISFMGKAGARLETRPDINIIEFINEATSEWPTDVEILTEFQQESALKYLLNDNRLAVMPSHIENSSLAVYEAAICGIPFIASNSGGTPEIIEAKFHSDVLCDAHPISLGNQLKKSLTKGSIVAAATFDNKENTKVWLNYHRNIKRIIKSNVVSNKTSELPKICIIIPHRDNIEGLKITLNAISKQNYHNLDVIVVDDNSVKTETLVALPLIKKKLDKNGWKYITTPGLDYGLAANLATKQSDASLFYFTQPGHAIIAGALEQMVNVLNSRNLSIVTGFSFEYSGNRIPTTSEGALQLNMPILGNIPHTMLQNSFQHWDILVDKKGFETIGGFTGDYRQVNAEKELYHALELNGFRGETIPKPLYWAPNVSENGLRNEGFNLRSSGIRALRPMLRYGPQIYRNLLLLTFGQYKKVSTLEPTLKRVRKNLESQKEAKQKRIIERDQLKERLQELNKKINSGKHATNSNIQKMPERVTANPEFTEDDYEIIRQDRNLKSAKLKERNLEVKELRNKLKKFNGYIHIPIPSIKLTKSLLRKLTRSK